MASPIIFDMTETNYLETNVTEVIFLNTAGEKIPIENLTDNIQSKEPYAKTNTYSDSNLYWKSWDSLIERFTASGCKSFVANNTELLCQTWDSSSLTTTNTSHWYCDSTNLVVASYDPPSSKTKDSDLEMVYPDYYALEFWQESMGFYLAVMAFFSYITGLWIVLFFDQFPRRKMLIKIYETVKRREVFEGYTEENDTISSGDDDNTSDNEEDSLVIGK